MAKNYIDLSLIHFNIMTTNRALEEGVRDSGFKSEMEATFGLPGPY